jgi:hypothetical protein
MFEILQKENRAGKEAAEDVEGSVIETEGLEEL